MAECLKGESAGCWVDILHLSQGFFLWPPYFSGVCQCFRTCKRAVFMLYSTSSSWQNLELQELLSFCYFHGLPLEACFLILSHPASACSDHVFTLQPQPWRLRAVWDFTWTQQLCRCCVSPRHLDSLSHHATLGQTYIYLWLLVPENI